MSSEQIADVRLVLEALEYVADGLGGEYGHSDDMRNVEWATGGTPAFYEAYLRLKAALAEIEA